jgi:hypothetical protein
MRSKYIVGCRSTARSRSTDQNESWRKGLARSNPSRSQADPWPLCPRSYPRPRPPDLGGGARSNGGETAEVQLFGATATHSLPRVGLHEGNDIANYMGSYSPRIGAARAEIHGNGGRGGDTAENSHGLRSPILRAEATNTFPAPRQHHWPRCRGNNGDKRLVHLHRATAASTLQQPQTRDDGVLGLDEAW